MSAERPDPSSIQTIARKARRAATQLAALSAETPMGHKVALFAIRKGEPVIKFGAVIGHATADIAPGDHVHLHNLRGGLR